MDNRINEIALHHGLDEQLDQTIEECAELILAIRKYKRHIDDVEPIQIYNLAKIGEEIVDVEIMIEQLKTLIEGFDFERFKDAQIKRELMRIKFKEGE